MTKYSIAKFCTLAMGILTIPAVSWAGTTAAGKETKEIIEQVKESCITGDLGVNVVSQYVTRGLVLENQGAIIQPYADLYFKVYEGDGFLNKVSIALGTWASFHSRKTDAGLVSGGPSSTRSYYEQDFTLGIPITFAKNFTFTPSYYVFLSPNDGFSTFHGVNLALAYDDTDLLGAFALHPKIQVLFELENKAGNGGDEGIYYEIGIAPSVPAGPVTISFPMTAGFGSSDFYAGNQGFGYFSAGVQVAYPLTFMPECMGTWTATGGCTYYHLGDALDDFNPGVRDADESEWVWNGGLVVAF